MNAIGDLEIVSERYRRAHCQKCQRKIMPLEIRAVIVGKFSGFLCERCVREELEVIPIRLKALIKELNKLHKMSLDERRSQLNRMMILKNLK